MSQRFFVSIRATPRRVIYLWVINDLQRRGFDNKRRLTPGLHREVRLHCAGVLRGSEERSKGARVGKTD